MLIPLQKSLRPVVVALLTLELCLLVLCTYAAVAVRFGGDIAEFVVQHGAVLPKALVFGSVVVMGLLSLGMYQLSQRLYFRDAVARIVVAALLAALVLPIIWFAVPATALTRGVAPMAVVLSVTSLLVVRYLYMRVVDADILKRRTLIIGATSAVSEVGRLRRRADKRGFQLVGVILLDEADGTGTEPYPYNVISYDRPLYQIARAHQVDEIVVGLGECRGVLPMEDLLVAKLDGIEVCDLPAFLERESRKLCIEMIRPSWMVFGEGFKNDILRRGTKRVFDVLLSAVVLSALLPVILLTAIVIKLEDGLRAPIFYRQVRVGKGGELFEVLKFRSMKENAEADGEARWAQEDDPRITRVGHYIRKWRIDEIPQLLNVLLGQMSIVGPRPERPVFVSQFVANIDYYNERHAVKPGITGWAQLRYQYGSSEHDALEKLKYDLYYVKNNNLVLDLVILLQTIEVVLWGKGAR